MTPEMGWFYSRGRSRFLLLGLLLSGLGPQALPAQPAKVAATIRPLVLGHLKFSTSTTSVEAHQAFVSGVLRLHLFEYRLALVEFRRAQQLDPAFAFAYWGEAMALNHAIWGEQDTAAARAVLQRFGPARAARLARISDERERGFFAAVENLYGAGTKVERDRAHARAMEALARRFPDDDEVQLFYALALFGAHAGVRDVPDYMRAAAIAQHVFTKNPQHPGAAHYLIHGVDDSTHAPLGIDAARVLSRIAPDSPHALHMTSHIFLMLGLWDDVVTANEASSAAANNWCDLRGLPQRHYGHGNFWLEYAYLQQGRPAAARALLLVARQESLDPSVPPPPVNEYDPDNSVQGSLVQMWSRYLLETGDWQDEIADWKFPLGEALDPNLTYAWTQGFRRTRLGQPDEAAPWLENFVATRARLATAIAQAAEAKPADQLYLRRVETLELILRSAMAQAGGRMAEAGTLARQAVAIESGLPDAFGPPFVDLPAREWLGQLTLQSGEPVDAEKLFGTQLGTTPLRSPTLLGLATAAFRAGHAEVAARALAQLRTNWHAADPAVGKKLTALAAELAAPNLPAATKR